MVKKQQMRWRQERAHLLLRVRTKTLDDDLWMFCVAGIRAWLSTGR
jgi:hypothetical protein